MASTRKSKLQSKTDPVLFDITGNGKGAVSVPGKHLIFRLHQGGRVEYDRPHRYERRFVRREYKISPEEVQEIIELVERPEFLELAEHYPSLPRGRRCYAVTNIAIKYKSQNYNRRITISDYQGGASSYPRGLSDLLQKIFQIHIKNH